MDFVMSIPASGMEFSTSFKLIKKDKLLMRPTFKLSIALSILALTNCIANAGSSTARLANISSRMICQTGDAVIVTEFIVQGKGNESFVLRALGPSLPGIPNALQDPTIRLLNARGKELDLNNNWMDNPDKDEIIALGLAPPDDRESAIIDTLTPGIYTSVLQGTHHSEGSALSEVYDLLDGSPQLSAVGSRGFVSVGDDVMLSGVIITGSGSLSVLVRALGPSLADAGLSGVLADPTLTLYNSNGEPILANDNWRDTQEAEIEATGLAPTNDLESALIADVVPGAYTAVVTGVGGTTGIGFVQFYSLAAPVRQLNPAPILKRGH